VRNRNMYYMTGLPGWMRFGYSPGWVGRSASGLGPGAEYLMTGQWPTPQMQMAAQGYPMGPMAPGAGYSGMPMMQPPMPMGYAGEMWGDPAAIQQQQLAALRQQAQFVQQQLEQINAEIERLQQSGQ